MIKIIFKHTLRHAHCFIEATRTRNYSDASGGLSVASYYIK
jgi:hypothetical protein